jgi:hypothetical protein
MGRQERPLPSGPLHDFAAELRALRASAGMSYRELSRRAGYSPSALSAAAAGEMLPTLPVTLAYVGGCGGDQPSWEHRWSGLATHLRRTNPGPPPPPGAAPPPLPAPGPDLVRAAAVVPIRRPVPRPGRPGAPGDFPGNKPSGGPGAVVRIGLAPLLLICGIVAAVLVASHPAPGGQTYADPATPGSSPLVSAFGSAPPLVQIPQRPPSSVPPSRSPASPSRPRALAVTALGAPDFGGYCQATGQGSVHLVADNAYGWRCAADNGTGDDAQAVCAWTFHTTHLTNRVADFNDPTSWQCWQTNGELGPLDFAAYCRQAGRPGAAATGTTAYAWSCAGDPGGIDTQAACRQLYHVPVAVSRFQNYYDRTTWQCWG